MYKFFILNKSNLFLNYNQFYFSFLSLFNFSKKYLRGYNLIKFNNYVNILRISKTWLFIKILESTVLDFKKLLFLLFSIRFIFINIFKAHGINMRIISLRKRIKTNLVFIRLGFSHGFLLYLPKSVLFRVFKRRYFLIASYDFNFLVNLTFHLRNFRKFFLYKLIGIKLLRDIFKIKIGKKKSF